MTGPTIRGPDIVMRQIKALLYGAQIPVWILRNFPSQKNTAYNIFPHLIRVMIRDLFGALQLLPYHLIELWKERSTQQPNAETHGATSVFPEYPGAATETGNYLDRSGQLITKSSGLTRGRIVFRLPLLRLPYQLRSRKSGGCICYRKKRDQALPGGEERARRFTQSKARTVHLGRCNLVDQSRRRVRRFLPSLARSLFLSFSPPLLMSALGKKSSGSI